MIELHKRHNDRRSDEIEERLKEMVFAFRVYNWPAAPIRGTNSDSDRSKTEHETRQETGNTTGNTTGNYSAPPNALLPCICEGDAVISDEEQLEKFLDELEYFMNVQKSISSDACFIDPRTGKIC